MAEVIRIAESASEAPPALPQNVEAEAALLGALMIDNRLVEDVQLKLKPLHFFEPLHGRIYEAILRLTDSNRIANPVTLKPLFDADDGIKEVGGPSYLAQLTGSGAAVIGARDFASQIYDLALLRALVGVGRELVEGALDTSEDVAPLAQIERAETELYKVAEEGGAEGKAKSFGEASKEALQLAETAPNSGGPRARRLKRQKGIGLVIVDYLQLLQGTGRSSNDNRVNEISEISRGLKTLAKELDVPVMALSQLSRAVEQREDKRPQLSDLRESGSIEQDADIVLFIYREDYYLAARQPADDHPEVDKWREEMARVYGLAEVIVAKQRHGSTGKIRLRFDSRITKFSDLVDEGYMPELRGG